MQTQLKVIPINSMKEKENNSFLKESNTTLKEKRKEKEKPMPTKSPTMKFLKIYLRAFTYLQETNNLKHLHVYLIFLSYRNTYSNICIPPLEEIAQSLDISTRQLERYIKSLQDNSAIIVEKINGRRHFFFPIEELIEKKSNYPTIHQTPIPPITEKFFEETKTNPNTFIKLHNTMLQDLISKNSSHLLTVYIRLLLHRNFVNGECFPSIRTLAAETNLSSVTANKHLKDLEDLGYIKKIKSEKQTVSNRYFFPIQEQLDTKSKSKKEKEEEN